MRSKGDVRSDSGTDRPIWGASSGSRTAVASPPSARAVRFGLAADIKEVVRADRPPRVRRLGVRREDQELIVALDANPDDHDRQVARAVRLVPKFLGGKPER